MALVVQWRHEITKAPPWRIADVVDVGAQGATGNGGEGSSAVSDRRHAGTGSRKRGLREAGYITRCHGVIGDIDRNIQDCLLAAAQALRPAEGNVKCLPSLHHLRERLASHRRLDDVPYIGHTDAPAVAFPAIDRKFQIRLAHDAEDTYFLDAWDRVQGGFGLLCQ